MTWRALFSWPYYVVLEYGEIDLARLLSKREKQRVAADKAKVAAGGKAKPAGANRIDDNFLRLYFEQMVEAVGTIHEQKIVHSDLKPANFMFVEGALKLIDFGIAKQVRPDPPTPWHSPRSFHRRDGPGIIPSTSVRSRSDHLTRWHSSWSSYQSPPLIYSPCVLQVLRSTAG